ncbi:hypothetical protein NC651_023408 [Populus alba x Populus x berolinensis]|nr:hypothetical protein NC651_023408 [Populus alba x Populus x berolinensis]
MAHAVGCELNWNPCIGSKISGPSSSSGDQQKKLAAGSPGSVPSMWVASAALDKKLHSLVWAVILARRSQHVKQTISDVQ